MAWVKLDDGFPEHPKVEEAGGDAAWLHVCALAYCNRNLTDGFISLGVVNRLSDRRAPRKLAERLVTAGIWDATEGGWTIHDYLDFQPSKAKVDAERAAARDRMAIARAAKEAAARSAELQANFAESSRNPDPTRPDVPSAQVSPTPKSLDSREGGGDNSASRLTAIAQAYASHAYTTAIAKGVQVKFQDRYEAKARSTALAHEDIGRLAEMFPTAPASVIAACLDGDKHALQYYPRADEIAAAEDGPENADIIAFPNREATA